MTLEYHYSVLHTLAASSQKQGNNSTSHSGEVFPEPPVPCETFG